MASDRTKDFENICQLFASDEAANAAIALQLLKGDKELEQQINQHYQPLLTASGKKTLRSAPALLRQLKAGKGPLKARLQIGTVPEIHASIQKLALNHQSLEVFPAWIRKLSNLKELALSGCGLQQLPAWIGELTQLTFLSIADNQIKELPASLGKLTQLEWCYIIGNGIETVPDSVEHLKQLQFFYVKEKNKINKAELAKIQQLLPHTHIY